MDDMPYDDRHDNSYWVERFPFPKPAATTVPDTIPDWMVDEQR